MRDHRLLGLEPHWRALSGYLFALILGSGLTADALAQSGTAGARAELVGDGSRTWVKERVVVEMGTKRKCTSGETYRFKSDGTVEIAQCANGAIDKRTVRWSITATPPLDMAIAFDGRSYQLSFGGTKARPQMRWRIPSTVKPEAQKDIYLSLSKD